MKISSSHHKNGIALIIVMLVIVALGILAGGFAYSMKVETTLARTAQFDSEYDWIGRSGLEFAKYVLALHMTVPNEGNYDSLNQKWAGGPMGTNDILANLSFDNVALGHGKFSIKIIDLERRYNINIADDVALRQAMLVMGVDADQSQIVVDSILDWIDTDDNTHLSGAENDYYGAMVPAYVCKSGYIDDISELLRVKGVTPEIYYGPKLPPSLQAQSKVIDPHKPRTSQTNNTATYPVGLVDLFTPMSARLLNINTASSEVLQLIPGIEPNIAQGIITFRSGPDGVDGTEDDVPFKSVGELVNVPGFSATGAANLSRFFTTRSATFEVTVTVEIDGRKRELVGVLRRPDARSIAVLHSHWK